MLSDKVSHIQYKISLEMDEDYPGLKMTNVYPYFINTGLYDGFKPLAR